MKKELLVINPRFNTYHWLAAGGIASGENDTVNNWYLNNCFQIKLSKDFLFGNKKLGLTVDKAHPWDMPFLQKHSVENIFAKNCFDEVVKSMLDNDYYILFTGLDDYYMKGKSLYHQQHFNHDGILTGYDDEKQTYTIAAYDERWVFNTFKVPQKCVNKAFQSEFVNYDGKLLALQFLKDVPVELDIKTIKKNLNEYLDSDLEKYPIEDSNETKGIVFYDYVEMYLDLIISGKITPEEADHRTFKMIYDSKKCMLDMLYAIEKKYDIPNEFSKQYNEVYDLANSIRLSYAKFKLKGEIKAINSVKQYIKRLKHLELTVLKNMLKR